MLVETDPDMTIQEQSVKFNTLEAGDIFRLADISYQDAIDNRCFYIATSSKQVDGLMVVSLHTGYHCHLKISEYTEVIVHQTKLVVTPNV